MVAQSARRQRRANQLLTNISLCVTIRNELYVELQKSLMERTRDKESQVRVQALFALSKMQGNGDEEDEDEEEGGTIIEKFLDLLQHDPAA